MLEVRLMGTFEIKANGKTVRVSSRAAQSLFAYLIVNAGASYRREKLAGMLWPDATEETARAYLRHELWRLRKALSHHSQDAYLISDDLCISFDASSDYWLDVAVLNKPNESASSTEFMDALSVYEGQFLPDFYDEWVSQEREHLQALYEQKMTQLLELLQQEKCWNDILVWAENWISSGHGPETAYRYLMAAYKAHGDHAKVHSTYERCKQALRELDLEPSEETRMLVSKRTTSLNVPIPLTSFIGREKELKEVADVVSKSRLVTLTGSGGVGKTRLAIQVVAEVLDLFPDGVWFLDLAFLHDAELVPDTLAEVLDLSLIAAPGASIIDIVAGYLHSRKALIIFDNCEHLIDSCAQLVHSLLTSCEHLSILVTSREALRVAGEMPYRVPSLALPRWDLEPDVDAFAKTESVRLFVERAAVVSPGFAFDRKNALIIAQICKRLDGIPLAIELAAARVNILAVEHILNRLDDRFHLLTGGLRSALPRHRTLHATIEWSYDLLSEKERLLFQRLAVFVGGWTLEAAEAVCSGGRIEASEVLDLLSQLVDKSLVLVDTRSEETRYRRLETIRQFAYGKFIESGEGDNLRRKHCAYYLDLGEQADRETDRSVKHKWKDRLEADNDNFRAAFKWCVSERDTGASLHLLGGWAVNGRFPFKEIEDKFNRILGLPEINAYPALYARLLNFRAGANWLRGNIQNANSYAEEAQAIWLKLGETGEVGLAECFEILGEVALSEKRLSTAQSFLEKSMELYQKHGDEWRVADTIFRLGHLATTEGHYDEAAEQYMKAHEIWKRLDPTFGVAATSNELGELARLQGDYDRAGKFYKRSVEAARILGAQALLSISLFNYAWSSLHTGDFQQAKELFKESLDLDVKDGNTTGIIYCLTGFAGILGMLGKHEEAAQLFGAAECLFKEIGTGPRDPTDQKEVDHYLGMVREQLDDVAFTKAWDAGGEMTIEQAIAFALKETGS